MIKTLYENRWISLLEMVDPEHDVQGYVFSHETRCKGQIVSIVPFRYSLDHLEFLLRREVTPCWSLDAKIVSSITGGVEDDNPLKTAVTEIREEAGYEVEEKDLISLGASLGIKSCDTLYFLYTVDLTNKEQTMTPTGDGSKLELKAENFWGTSIGAAMDPFVYVIYYRL